jgi:hypothetical protein
MSSIDIYKADLCHSWRTSHRCWRDSKSECRDLHVDFPCDYSEWFALLPQGCSLTMNCNLYKYIGTSTDGCLKLRRGFFIVKSDC